MDHRLLDLTRVAAAPPPTIRISDVSPNRRCCMRSVSTAGCTATAATASSVGGRVGTGLGGGGGGGGVVVGGGTVVGGGNVVGTVGGGGRAMACVVIFGGGVVVSGGGGGGGVVAGLGGGVVVFGGGGGGGVVVGGGGGGGGGLVGVNGGAQTFGPAATTGHAGAAGAAEDALPMPSMGSAATMPAIPTATAAPARTGSDRLTRAVPGLSGTPQGSPTHRPRTGSATGRWRRSAVPSCPRGWR